MCIRQTLSFFSLEKRGWHVDTLYMYSHSTTCQTLYNYVCILHEPSHVRQRKKMKLTFALRIELSWERVTSYRPLLIIHVEINRHFIFRLLYDLWINPLPCCCWGFFLFLFQNKMRWYVRLSDIVLYTYKFFSSDRWITPERSWTSDWKWNISILKL